MQTRSDATSFTLRQSAQAGALGFSSAARADAMPRTVLGFGVSVNAIVSKKWRFRVGHAGMLVDGKPEHAVAAGVQIRF